MQQQEDCQNTTTSTAKRKKYRKPKLTVLGKVTELTAGGSGSQKENQSSGPTGDPNYYQKRS